VISYLDTSALVKLYIFEEGTPQVKELVDNSFIVATCKIAYAEARAALARGHRENALNDELYTGAVAALKDDWHNYFTIEVSDTLIEQAGELAIHFTSYNAPEGFKDIKHPQSPFSGALNLPGFPWQTASPGHRPHVRNPHHHFPEPWQQTFQKSYHTFFNLWQTRFIAIFDASAVSAIGILRVTSLL